ncbi:MAG: pilus assembly protein PilM [bacterium]
MKINFLKKILSAPNYLNLPFAGIEICNRSIKYIEFANKKGLFFVKNFGEILLPSDIIKDGDVLNKDILIKTLIEVKNNISTNFVKVSIPEEKTYLFNILISKEARTNIREALEFKIEENIPLKLEESCFEYEIIDDNKLSKDMTLDVAVIPKKIIADWTDLFYQAGIYPLSYKIESKMIANSVISKGDKDNSIIINIKDDSTLFIAFINGFVRFTSSTAIGENMIRKNLFKTGLFKNEAEISHFFESDFSFETKYEKETYSALVNIFSVLKDEVEKFNEYIINEFLEIKSSPAKKINKIILCGRSSVLPGLAKHINQKINTKIILANVWSEIFDIKENISKIKFNDSLNFVTPIGLIIPK